MLKTQRVFYGAFLSWERRARIPALDLHGSFPIDQPCLSDTYLRLLGASNWDPESGRGILTSEPVTDSTHGFDVVASCSHLLTKSTDVNVNGTVEDECILAKCCIHKFSTRKCSTGLSDQRSNSLNSLLVKLRFSPSTLTANRRRSTTTPNWLTCSLCCTTSRRRKAALSLCSRTL